MEATFVGGCPLAIKYTPGSAISAGQVVVIGDAAFIAHEDIAANAPGTLYAGGGIYDVTADAAIATGKKVYWNDSANKITATANGNKCLGIVMPGYSSAADGDSIRIIHLQDISGSTPATAITALTDSTGGTANNTVQDVGASFSQSTLNNNFADLAAKINEFRTNLIAAGILKSS